MPGASHDQRTDPGDPGDPQGVDVRSDTQAELAGRMRLAISRLGRRLRQTRAGTDLPPTQAEVLTTLVVRGPLRLSELAVIEGLNPTMLSRIAGKLEAAGLVGRVQDTSDGRVAHLAVTPEGRALQERIRSERTDVLNQALAGLTERERRTLDAALPVLEALAESLKDRPR